MISSVLAAVNVLLIAGLLYVYGKNFVKIRSGFTFGLVFFALLFLFHNVLVLYFNLTMMSLYAEGVMPYMIAFTSLQAVAFAILNWVSWR